MLNKEEENYLQVTIYIPHLCKYLQLVNKIYKNSKWGDILTSH